jgi:hypothetical protein
MSDEKEVGIAGARQPVQKTIKEKYADVTLRIIEDHGHEFGALSPEKEKKLRRKLYWYIMFLVSAINLMLFVSVQRGQKWVVLLIILG